jgi:hypothetical protein
VLGRIEELEAREREREEILAELVPALEARGYDTGVVKAVIGGGSGLAVPCVNLGGAWNAP